MRARAIGRSVGNRQLAEKYGNTHRGEDKYAAAGAGAAAPPPAPVPATAVPAELMPVIDALRGLLGALEGATLAPVGARERETALARS